MTDLEAIKARLAAATPGPWVVTETSYGKSVGHPIDDEDTGQLFIESYGITYPYNRADADLIAHAPTDLAALVAEVERLRHLLGSHADGHRCTCKLTAPQTHIQPAEWEQDPWCLTHPNMDYIVAEVQEMRSDVKRLSKARDRADALRRAVEKGCAQANAELEAARKVCEAARAYVNYEYGDGNLVDLEIQLSLALDGWEKYNG